jgi:hypothetical protein
VPTLDGDDATEHVDGDHTVRVVVAVLADDAEGAAAETRGTAPPPALAEKAQVLGAVEAGLALAALAHGVDGGLLEGANVGGELVHGDKTMKGSDVAQGVAAEEDGILPVKHRRVGPVTRVGREARAGQGGDEVAHGGVPRGDAAKERGGLAALGPVYGTDRVRRVRGRG